MRINYKILLLTVLLLAFFTIPVAANHGDGWQLNESWMAPINITSGSTGVVVIQLHNEFHEPVNPEDCDSMETQYVYPPGNSEGQGDLEYINSSPGFYAGQFQAVEGENEINIDVFNVGGCDFPGGKIDTSLTGLNTSGNLTANIVNTTDNPFLEDQEYNLWLEVLQQGDFEDGVDANWTIYNWKGGREDYDELSKGAGEFYEDENGILMPEVDLPEVEAGKYFLVFRAEKDESGLDYYYPFGGTAKIIEVAKDLKFEFETIDLFRAMGRDGWCAESNKKTLGRCQKGAKIQVRLRENRSSASEVEGGVSGNGKNLTQKGLNFTEISEGLWIANFTIPTDLDTSKFGKELDINVIGRNDLSKFEKTDSVDLSVFEVDSLTREYAFQGGEIEILFGAGYEFIDKFLSKDKMDTVSLEIHHPNGTTWDIWKNKDVSNLSAPENYRENLRQFRYVWDVPETASTEDPYNFKATLVDKYGEKKSKLFNFQVVTSSIEDTNVMVKAISSSLSGSGSRKKMRKTFDTTGNKVGEVILNNSGSKTATVENVAFEGDLENISSAKKVSGDSLEDLPFDIPPGEARSLQLNFSLRKFTTYTGKAVFEINGDTRDYERTIDVELDLEDPCRVEASEDKTFCLFTSGITNTYTDRKTRTHEVRIRSLSNSSISVTPQTKGGISELLSLPTEPISIENGKTRTFSFSVEPSIALNGQHKGSVIFGDNEGNVAELPVDFKVDIPEGELDLEMNGKKDLGEVVQGDSKEFDVTIRNTGNISLEGITLESSKLEVDQRLGNEGEPLVLESGREITPTIDLATGVIPPGDYTGENEAVLTARSDSGAQDSINIALVVVENVEEDIPDLERKISEFESDVDALEGRADSRNLDIIQENLDSLRSNVEDAKQAIEEENYQEAARSFSEAKETASKLGNLISNAEKEAPDKGSTSSGEGSSGGILWIIIVTLVVVILVALVIYLSIVPDEERGGAQGGTGEPEYGPPM